MGRTYEALERAEKDYQAYRQSTSRAPQPVGQQKPLRRMSIGPAIQPYQDLKVNLLNRYSHGAVKSVLFAGSARGDGTSTTAVNFATILAKDGQFRVLLIDANLRTPSLHGVFKTDHLSGLSDLTNGGRGNPTPMRVGPGELYLVPCGRDHTEPATLFESKEFGDFLKKMRDDYDYVVLDSPPVPGFVEHRVLCARVDGVILVIEAGKTHRQVALSAKKQLEEAGGKLLGVVLNKRKHYIPEFIYRLL